MTARLDQLQHKPVLLAETLELLNLHPGLTVIDATVGLGGHAKQIFEQIKPTGRLIGLDQNETSLLTASQRLPQHEPNLRLLNENFRQLGQIIDREFEGKVDRVLFDLGLASWQLDEPGLGLSFQRDEPLDMRLDRRQRETAANLIADRSVKELTAIFRGLGDEPRAQKIAEAIKREPPQTTRELAELILQVKGRSRRSHHPATQVFQALRMAVNDELGALQQALLAGLQRLNPAGRIVVLAYHSGEDRLVKQLFRQAANPALLSNEPRVLPVENESMFRLLTRHAMKADDREIQLNNRSRSVRLRAIEQL